MQMVKENECSFKVLGSFGQWQVMAEGLECITAGYFIPLWMVNRPFCELVPGGGISWETHMAEKGWCNPAEFKAALEFARAINNER